MTLVAMNSAFYLGIWSFWWNCMCWPCIILYILSSSPNERHVVMSNPRATVIHHWEDGLHNIAKSTIFSILHHMKLSTMHGCQCGYEQNYCISNNIIIGWYYGLDNLAKFLFYHTTNLSSFVTKKVIVLLFKTTWNNSWGMKDQNHKENKYCS